MFRRKKTHPKPRHLFIKYNIPYACSNIIDCSWPRIGPCAILVDLDWYCRRYRCINGRGCGFIIDLLRTTWSEDDTKDLTSKVLSLWPASGQLVLIQRERETERERERENSHIFLYWIRCTRGYQKVRRLSL